MGAAITTGLEPIIEALRECRAELAEDNTRAEQIEHARGYLAECEARLDSFPRAPEHDGGRDSVLRYAHWLKRHDALVADMRAARDYLHGLQFRPEFVGYETPDHEDDETHEPVDYRSWQQREADDVGVPMRGEF